MHKRQAFFLLVIALMMASCTSGPDGQPISYPTYDPFLPMQGQNASGSDNVALDGVSTRTGGPAPTHAPITIVISTRQPGASLATPTPDIPRSLPTPRQAANQYTVQQGDTLGSVAQAFGISVEALEQANNLDNSSVLSIGQSLGVPPPSIGASGPSFKVIPDSELVYGPASAEFDIDGFIQGRHGYLAAYTQDINEDTVTGAQVVQLVAQSYSVNPRLLLALLDYRSNWVSSAVPAAGTADYPLGFVEPNHAGLYRQLSWAANELKPWLLPLAGERHRQLGPRRRKHCANRPDRSTQAPLPCKACSQCWMTARHGTRT